MSTFFKSAAMSLLSRTLQTLLYKYLSDVDVEGVNMPSLLSGGGMPVGGGGGGGGDGHSGWGVRLSNVVLREGAKLLDLPGRVRRRRPKPSTKTKRGGRRRAKTKPTPAPSKGDSRVAAAAGTTTSNKSGTEDKRSKRGRSSSCGASVASSSHGENDESTRTDAAIEANTSPDLHGGDAETIATQSTAASTIVSSSNMGGSGINATSASGGVGGVEGKPTVAPTKPRSSSWFSWYGSHSSGSAAVEPGTGEVGTTPETLQEEDDEDGRDDEINVGSKTADTTFDPLVGTLPDANETVKGDEYDDDDDGDSREAVDDQNDEDGTMILRLGKGSRIGTLDVRLIGRTIHVYVEDAILCVEVLRVAAPPAPDKKGETGTASSRDGEMGSASQSSANGEAAAAASGATPKRPPPTARKSSVSGAPAEPEPKTTGERVLAENAIAKMLSAIPNLFLRDIRIQVILRSDLAIDPAEIDNLPALGEPLGGNDSLLDVSIELLSVTDGEDFLAKFRSEAAVHFDGDDDPLYPTQRAEKLGSVHPTDLYEDLNEYLVKRIRTGRGPDGGICVRVFPPQQSSRGMNPVEGVPWARQRWMSTTDYCLLRCSGLDIHARIFLGVRDDEADDLNNSSWFATGPYDEYDVDSMLFSGVDYIVPGPQPPLPPISNNEEVALAAEGDKFWTHDGATVYRTDENGIQSSSVTSSFHRVARGLVPVISCDDHLPCEDNPSCWKPLSGEARNHPLDDTTPMGGLVLNILTRDPLEINVDRQTLLVLGDMVSMFTKKAPTEEPAQDYLDDTSELEKERNAAALAGTSEKSRATRKSTRNHETGVSLSALHIADDQHELVSEDIANAFPSYMRPEKIQMLGFHCSDLQLRVHVMREDGLPDAGFSYGFWEVAAKCTTIDYQSLARVPEKSFQDLRFDIGYITMNEFRGSECQLLMSLGLRQRVVDFDDMTIETFKTREELSDRSPWPSTAAALLEVQPPLETLVYEERDRHAFQFRYVIVGTPIADPDRSWTSMNARLGPSSVDAPYSIKDQIPTVISSIRTCVFGPAAVEKTPGEPVVKAATPSPAVKAIMKYKIQIDGGHIILQPRMNVKMPLTVVTGERSQELGLSFQTELDRVRFAYGEHTMEPRALEVGLSLQQLAELTETVRLRVLLFLSDHDLEALEQALCVKREQNSFLRCRSVNKGLLRAAKRHGRFRSRIKEGEPGGRAAKTPNRRQELMSELLKMDDDALEDLVMVHRRYSRKSSKRNT